MRSGLGSSLPTRSERIRTGSDHRAAFLEKSRAEKWALAPITGKLLTYAEARKFVGNGRRLAQARLDFRSKLRNGAQRFLKLAAQARSRITEVSVEETVAAVARGALVIDVRERDEFWRGHIRMPGISLKRTLELEIEKRAPDPATGNESFTVAQAASCGPLGR